MHHRLPILVNSFRRPGYEPASQANAHHLSDNWLYNSIKIAAFAHFGSNAGNDAQLALAG